MLYPTSKTSYNCSQRIWELNTIIEFKTSQHTFLVDSTDVECHIRWVHFNYSLVRRYCVLIMSTRIKGKYLHPGTSICSVLTWQLLIIYSCCDYRFLKKDTGVVISARCWSRNSGSRDFSFLRDHLERPTSLLLQNPQKISTYENQMFFSLRVI